MQQKSHTSERRRVSPVWWRRFWRWILHHRIFVILGIVIGLLLAASMLAFVVFYQNPTQNVDVPLTHQVRKKPAAPKFYSSLTGLEVADEAATKSNVTAIIIENSPDARPQSGIQEADVVYEAIAEGGVTRFAALYQQSRPELVGPVRSLRMYYIDWITPYDPAVAHVGGSLFSLQEIRNGNHKDIDQFFNPGAYWRTSDRYAPHNVYTSFARLDELNTAKGFTSANPQAIPRGDKPLSGPPANHIDVVMSGPLYNSSWQYDPASKTYLRSQAGAPHIDRERGQVSAQVVIVLKMHMDTVMEDGWRENYHTAGTGDAVIFAGGTVVNATWHKENMSKQLFFTSKENGQPLEIPRGKTWISAVPVNVRGGVSWQ